MLCKKCGQNIDEWEVCPHCGEVQTSENAAQPQPAPAQKPSKLLQAALILLGVLGIVHALPELASVISGCIRDVGSMLENAYGFDAFRLIELATELLYTLSLPVGCIVLLARKPKAAILVPITGLLHYLYWTTRFLTYFFAFQFDTAFLALIPAYLLYLIPFLMMAVCMLLGKLEWLALVPILPAALSILRMTVGLVQILGEQGLSNPLSSLSGGLTLNAFHTALILFCIAYVVCVRIRKKQHQPA